MIMFKRLPYFVFLQGKKYKINVDFRNMIFFEQQLQDKSIDNASKIIFALSKFYYNYEEIFTTPELYEEACEKLVWFYRCGREDYHKACRKCKSKKKTNL